MHEEWLPGGLKMCGAPGVFPLGQDSVLLADFARPKPRGRALDLGSGAGVLSLLLLGKYPALRVTALEFSPAAAALSRENCARNDLAARMDVCGGDLREIRALLPPQSFDFVICNPPFFAASAGKAHLTLPAARSEQTCTIADVARAAAFVLKQGGKCAAVYAPPRLCALLAAFSAADLAPKRLRMVHRRVGSPPSAVLVEGMKGAKEGLLIAPPLFIEAPEGGFSDEYKTIYHLE